MVRIKQRYLLLNILYPDTALPKVVANSPDFLKFHAPTPQHISSQDFLGLLRTHIAASFGDQGLGLCRSSLKLIYWSNATSTAILRVPRAYYQIVWASLSYLTEMPATKGRNSSGLPCVVRVVRVSGTIRKAEEELLRRSRTQIAQAKLAGIDNHAAALNRLAGANSVAPTLYSNNEERDPASPIFDNEDIDSEGSDNE